MVRGKCTVCDSPNATNYHFGAQSCKACAAFFRRSIAMNQTYDCIGDGVKSCKIDHTLRLNCRHCRLRKCLRAGMVKDLVQAKRDVKVEGRISKSEEYQYQQPSTSNYPPPPENVEIFYPASENEWDTSPPEKSLRLSQSEDLMDYNELQQFIRVDEANFQPLEDDTITRTRLDSMNSELSAATWQWQRIEEEERIYAVVALYTDQVINLNMRRKITYTDRMLGTVFDGACVCPYEKSDLKVFDHRTYRQKNRNDYTMILDYINRFPEFEMLSKSEKTVLFRTAAAVDVLVDQAYYSQIIFPDEAVIVTANGEYLRMDPYPLVDRDSGYRDRDFESDEDYEKFKSLTQMKCRQWQRVVEPLKKLKMSLPEFALFKALTIWHYNYYKLQESGRQICARQRDDIFRCLLIICEDEGYSDALLRASDVVLAVGTVMAEVHEMITAYIEIMVMDVLDDPILKDMLKFQY